MARRSKMMRRGRSSSCRASRSTPGAPGSVAGEAGTTVRSPGTRGQCAFELQLVDAVPEAAWDERVDAVATEARLLVAPGKELST